LTTRNRAGEHGRPLRELVHNLECTGARQGVLQIFKAGVLYFSLVFATGFVLGNIRVFWIVPILGVRWAELMELPVMLVVTILAARWAARILMAHAGCAA
jgi:hypothetical protein